MEQQQQYHHHQGTVIDESLISPHENDVLMGRGGKNNQHSGNEKLRKLARGYCSKYRVSSKKGKSSISRQIVQQMRDLQPPARFLKRDSHTGSWVDVGDDIAREKASQVLRDAVALLQDETSGKPTEGAATDPSSDDDSKPKPPSKNGSQNGISSRDHNGGRIVSQGMESAIDSVAARPEHTPSLVESVNTSASFPPPTPLEHSRKRHRQHYSDDENLLLQSQSGAWLPPQSRRDVWSESPTRRRRSDPHQGLGAEVSSEPRRRSPHHETSQLYPTALHNQHSQGLGSTVGFSAHSQQGEYDSSSHRTDAYLISNPNAQRFVPPVSISRSYHVPYGTQHQAGIPEYHDSSHSAIPPYQQWHLQASSQNMGWKQQDRPQSIVGARQASIASYGSLLGEVGQGTGLTDFDLFNGGLLDDGIDESQQNLGTSSSASPR
ncbi:hypothetical protein ACA910_022112 [Epithemia clementina (nom. ined.)]